MDVLTTRYSENLTGVLSCYDRIVITGTLPGACFADGMTGFLRSRGIRIFDYPHFALPLREHIRPNAQALAAEHDATIEHIAKAHIPKKDGRSRFGAKGPGLEVTFVCIDCCLQPTNRLATLFSLGAPVCSVEPPQDVDETGADPRHTKVFQAADLVCEPVDTPCLGRCLRR